MLDFFTESGYDDNMMNEGKKMFEVTLKSGRKIVSRTKFSNMDDAFYFISQNERKYTCEFIDLAYFGRK